MDCPPSIAAAPQGVAAPRPWPAGGFTSAPYWVYSDPDVYAREQEVIFRGRSWHYLGLEAEVPEPGSYKNTYMGDANVLLTRAEDGSLNAMLNRCAHRGNMVCREAFGKVQKLHCVYHSWNYNLKGDLTFVAFRNGLRGEGGLPADFDPAEFQDPETGAFTTEFPEGTVFFDSGATPDSGVGLVREAPEVNEDGRGILMTYSDFYVDWELSFSSPLPAHVIAQRALGIEDAMEAKQAVLDAIANEDTEVIGQLAAEWNNGFNFTEMPSDTSVLVTSNDGTAGSRS